MFSNAVKAAMAYTRPLMRVRKYHDERVEFPLSSVVILNDEGWFVSAGHSWSGIEQLQHDAIAIGEFEQKVRQIQGEITGKKKSAHKFAKLRPNPNWVTHDLTLCLFPSDGREFPVADVQVYPLYDFAIGRLESFDPSLIKNWPVFAASGRVLDPGTQLCKLGFPFPSIGGAGATVENGNLAIHFDDLQLPYFPLEGMFTRTKVVTNTEEPSKQAHFLESSTPGLPGQSGGPWVDVSGTIWAIQSHTTTIDLNMNGIHQEGRNQMSYPQFLNLGHGISVEHILEVLDERGIGYSTV